MEAMIKAHTNGNGASKNGRAHLAGTIKVVALTEASTQGERIQALLKLHGLTQRDAAVLLDIPVSSVSGMCRDTLAVSYARLQRMAELFGVSANFIRFGTDTPPIVEVEAKAEPTQAPPPVSAPAPVSNWRVAEIARLMEQVSPSLQRAILAAVRALVDAAHDSKE